MSEIEKEFLTTFQAARLLSVTPDTILKWIKAGKVKAMRTAGGHYRIHQNEIQNLVSSRGDISKIEKEKLRPEVFQFCWEFNAKVNIHKYQCSECIVFKTKARHCYEMRHLPKKYGHLKIFCSTECKDCDYFKKLKADAYSILVITRKKINFETYRNDPYAPPLNIISTDNEYECSTIVENFKPDYAVIDWSIDGAEGFCKNLVNDSRVPDLKIILFRIKNIKQNSIWEKQVIGKLEGQLSSEKIYNVIELFKSRKESITEPNASN
jgi:excisionase family DNA binding protein